MEVKYNKTCKIYEIYIKREMSDNKCLHLKKKISNLTLQLMVLEKVELTKTKVSRKGDMAKTRGRELSTTKFI